MSLTLAGNHDMTNPRDSARLKQENYLFFRILKLIAKLIRREEAPVTLNGIRHGELWKVSKLQKHIGVSPKLMATWISKGLVTKDLGSDSPFCLTDDLIQFYRDQPAQPF